MAGKGGLACCSGCCTFLFIVLTGIVYMVLSTVDSTLASEMQPESSNCVTYVCTDEEFVLEGETIEINECLLVASFPVLYEEGTTAYGSHMLTGLLGYSGTCESLCEQFLPAGTTFECYPLDLNTEMPPSQRMFFMTRGAPEGWWRLIWIPVVPMLICMVCLCTAMNKGYNTPSNITHTPLPHSLPHQQPSISNPMRASQFGQSVPMATEPAYIPQQQQQQPSFTPQQPQQQPSFPSQQPQQQQFVPQPGGAYSYL